jgi:hypothetical protein
MKPVNMESSIGLDRIATCNEVRCAMAVSSQSPLELVACDDFHEMHSDFTACAYNLPEEIVWLAIRSEIPDLSN